MGEAVEDVVHAELEASAGEVDRIPTVGLIRPFPVVADVVVVVDDDHQSLRGVVVLEDAVEQGVEVGQGGMREVEVFDPEEDLEHRMAGVELDQSSFRQHLGDLALEVAKIAAVQTHVGEVVDDQEAALQQVLAERFRLAMSDGQKAITALNAATAIKQFEIATALKPGSEQAQRALTRARSLPAVLSHMADCRKLESSGDIDEAAKKYETAASLDPQHRPAREHLLRIKKIISDRDYQDAVTQALALIEQKNLKGAARALKRAQKIRPNTGEIIEIRQRLKTAAVNATLEAFHENAKAYEIQEKWSHALAVYKKALAIDKDAAFAQRGERRAQRQVKLHNNIDLYLTNPARLQSPEPMTHAKALLGQTTSSSNAGRLLQSKGQRLRELIALAETPVSVVLRSDGKTTVTLYRVGIMGRFDIREIKLKPGRYTATGSRSGFRDVRLVFRVTPGSQNINVRIECTEPIGR